jgi:hypothetical protein
VVDVLLPAKSDGGRRQRENAFLPNEPSKFNKTSKSVSGAVTQRRAGSVRETDVRERHSPVTSVAGKFKPM